MNLKLKLLTVFSLAAFAALSLFGLVAYDTALEESEKIESRLIFTILSEDLEKVALVLQQQADIHSAIKAIDSKKDLHFLITKENNQPVYSSPELNKITSVDLTQLATPEIQQGNFEIDEHEYHWKVLPILNTPYSVTSIYHHTPDSENSFFMGMAVSLAVTAFIVIWVAAWSAVYIGALVEKLSLQKKELEKLATHDNLTGLPNRRLLFDRLEQSIELAKRDKARFALCFIDLNHFKQINDLLGHQYGDRVLQKIAQRLTESIRQSDTVARLGGDELAIVLNKSDRQGAQTVVEKLIRVIEEPILFKDKEYSVSASIGITVFPENGQNPNYLVKKADDAMYFAKRNGIRFQHYDDIPADEVTDSEMIHSEFDQGKPKPI